MLHLWIMTTHTEYKRKQSVAHDEHGRRDGLHEYTQLVS